MLHNNYTIFDCCLCTFPVTLGLNPLSKSRDANSPFHTVTLNSGESLPRVHSESFSGLLDLHQTTVIVETLAVQRNVEIKPPGFDLHSKMHIQKCRQLIVWYFHVYFYLAFYLFCSLHFVYCMQFCAELSEQTVNRISLCTLITFTWNDSGAI